jgi:hypothetical protein
MPKNLDIWLASPISEEKKEGLSEAGKTLKNRDT